MTKATRRLRIEQGVRRNRQKLRANYERSSRTWTASVVDSERVRIGGAVLPASGLGDASPGDIVSVQNVGTPSDAVMSVGKGAGGMVFRGGGGGTSGGGTTDHHQLTNLATFDDHPQYVATAVARSISAQHTFAFAGAPFTLATAARGNLVTGLKADAFSRDLVEGTGITITNPNLTDWEEDGDITVAFNTAANLTITGSWQIQGAWTFDRAGDAPFLLGTAVQGNVVAGLKAASLDKTLVFGGMMVDPVGDISDHEDADDIQVALDVTHNFSGGDTWTGTHAFSKPINELHSAVFAELTQANVDLVGAAGSVYYDSSVADTDIVGPGLIENDNQVGGLLLYDHGGWGMLHSTQNTHEINAQFHTLDATEIRNLNVDGDLLVYANGNVATPNDQQWVTSIAQTTPETIQGWRIYETDGTARHSKLEIDEIEATRMRIKFFTVDTYRARRGQIIVTESLGELAQDTTPITLGGNKWMYFEDIPEIGLSVPIFEPGEWVLFSYVKFTDTGGFEYDGEVWFKCIGLAATGPLNDGFIPDRGVQVWNMQHVDGGFADMVMPQGAVGLGYGDGKGSRIWINGLREKDGPFIQMGEWQDPNPPANNTIPSTVMKEHVKIGTLQGVRSYDNRDFGFAAAVDISQALLSNYEGFIMRVDADSGDTEFGIYNGEFRTYSSDLSAWTSLIDSFGRLRLGTNVYGQNGVSFYVASYADNDVLGSGKNMESGDAFLGDWMTDGNFIHYEKSTGTVTIRGLLQVEDGTPIQGSVERATNLQNNVAGGERIFTVSGNVVSWAEFRIRTSLGNFLIVSAGSYDMTGFQWPRVMTFNIQAWYDEGEPSPVTINAADDIVQWKVETDVGGGYQPLVWALSGAVKASVNNLLGRTLISGDWINTGTINADRMVTNISFVNNYIQLGTMAWIYANKFNYGDTTPGLYFGYDAFEADWVMNVGSSSNYIKWTGDAVEVQGTIRVLDQTSNPGGPPNAWVDPWQRPAIVNLCRVDGSFNEEPGDIFYVEETSLGTLRWSNFKVTLSDGSYFFIGAGSYGGGATRRNVWISVPRWIDNLDADNSQFFTMATGSGTSTDVVGHATSPYEPANATLVCHFSKINNIMNFKETLGTTRIGGGWIQTGSVIADNIAAGAITTNKLAAGSVTADKINATQIWASKSITLGTSAHIKSTGKDSPQDVTAGFYLGYSGSDYQFGIGDGNRYMIWDGSQIQFRSDRGIRIDMASDATSYIIQAYAQGGAVGYIRFKNNSNDYLNAFEFSRSIVALGTNVNVQGHNLYARNDVTADADISAGNNVKASASLVQNNGSAYGHWYSFQNFPSDIRELAVTSSDWSADAVDQSQNIPGGIWYWRLGEIIFIYGCVQRSSSYQTRITVIPEYDYTGSGVLRPQQTVFVPCTIQSSIDGNMTSHLSIQGDGDVYLEGYQGGGNSIERLVFNTIYRTS